MRWYDQHFLTSGGWPLIGIPETAPWTINSSFFHYEKIHGSIALFNLVPFFDVMDSSKYVLYVCFTLASWLSYYTLAVLYSLSNQPLSLVLLALSQQKSYLQ